MWLLQQANRNLPPPPSHQPPTNPPPTPFIPSIPLHLPPSPFHPLHPLHPLPPPPSTACSFHWLRANFKWPRSTAGGIWQVCWYIGDDQHSTWTWSEVAYPGIPHTIHGGDDLRSWSFCVTVLCVWCWRTVDTGVGLGLRSSILEELYVLKGRGLGTRRCRMELLYSSCVSFIFPPFLLPPPFSFLSPSSRMCSTVCTVAVLILVLYLDP